MNDIEMDRLADRVVDKMRERGAGVGPRLMDIAATAVYMGRTVAGVQQMIKRGTLPSTRIDGKIQVDRLELDRLIKDRTA